MLDEHKRRAARCLETVLEATIDGIHEEALMAEVACFRLELDVSTIDSLDPALEGLGLLSSLASARRLAIGLRMHGLAAEAVDAEARGDSLEARLLAMWPWLEEDIGDFSDLLLTREARESALGLEAN